MKEYKIPQVKLSYVSDGDTVMPKVTASNKFAEWLRKQYDMDQIEYRETFMVAYLNRQNRILGVQVISQGGTTATLVDLKMILTGALLANAQSVIAVHNHPSGNLCPSGADDALTQKIKNGCEAVDLKLLDHIILTKNGFYSYNDNGRL